MHRPVIMYNLSVFPVSSIDWTLGGELYSVVFYPQGEYKMAFNTRGKEGYDDYGRLRLNLSNRLKWSESDADM